MKSANTFQSHYSCWFCFVSLFHLIRYDDDKNGISMNNILLIRDSFLSGRTPTMATWSSISIPMRSPSGSAGRISMNYDNPTFPPHQSDAVASEEAAFCLLMPKKRHLLFWGRSFDGLQSGKTMPSSCVSPFWSPIAGDQLRPLPTLLFLLGESPVMSAE